MDRLIYGLILTMYLIMLTGCGTTKGINKTPLQHWSTASH